MKSASEQMRVNLEAVLFRYHGLPRLRPISRFQGRVRWRATESFVAMIAADPKFRPWNAVANHGPTAVRGWREDVPRWSVQVIQHGEFGKDDVEIEADIDRANPDYGLAFLVLHGIQDVLGLGRPDAFQVARALQKRGIAVRLEAPDISA